MTEPQGSTRPGTGSTLALIAAWLAVGIPMLWGVWTTIRKASLLFR